MRFCLLSSRTNHFFLFFYQSFFNFPPPCLVSHFSLFTLLFTLPDFLQQLASPACLHFVSLCGLCFFAAVRVSRTDEESVRFRPPLSSTAPYPNAESKQVFEHPPPRLRLAIVSERETVLQPFLPAPYPRCGRDHKPNGPFRLRAVVITDPSLRPLYKHTLWSIP